MFYEENADILCGFLKEDFFANPEFRLSSFDKVRLPQLKGGARPKRKKTNTR